MAQVIQLKRGAKANLPASAAAGEPLVTTDTHELSFGTGSGISPAKVDYANVLNPPAIPDVSAYSTTTQMNAAIASATSGLASTASVTAAIAAATIDGGTF